MECATKSPPRKQKPRSQSAPGLGRYGSGRALEGLIGYAARAIGHPDDVNIALLSRSVDRVVQLDLLRPRSGQGTFPLVDLSMAVGEGQTSSGVVVIRRLIDPGCLVGIEETGVVDAVRMLIQVNPSLARSRDDKVAGLFDVFVNRVPRACLGIAVADANVAGKTAHALFPTQLPLWAAQVVVGWAFQDVPGIPEVFRQLRVFLIDEEQGLRKNTLK